jgi:hypothetical protein
VDWLKIARLLICMDIQDIVVMGYGMKVLVSPTYQRFLKPLKSFDIIKNDADITSFLF